MVQVDHLLQNRYKEAQLIVRQVLEECVEYTGPLGLVQDFEPYQVRRGHESP